MKLKPLADRVILKQFKAEEKTKSGLILAASAMHPVTAHWIRRLRASG